MKREWTVMTKRERIETVMNGEEPDVVPAGFWFHYRPDYTVEQMIEAHMDLFRSTDMDVIKIMPDFPYALTGEIHSWENWSNIAVKGTDCEEFGKMAAVIRGIRKEAGNDVMIFQTMFGPFKAASIQYTDPVLMRYSREYPEEVIKGVNRLAEGLAVWAKGFLDAGADGIYYSAQFSEPGRFSKEEWEKLVKPSDLYVLNAVKEQGGKTILHICGEPEYQFRTNVAYFSDYPGDIVNWSVKDNGISLQEGYELFHRPVLGGMNNKGNILTGPIRKIEEEADQVISSFGTKGFMLGADCTIQGKGISKVFIHAAVEAAHNYKLSH